MVFVDGRVQDTHSVLQKSTDAQSKRFGVKESCMELCGTVDIWVTLSLQTVFLDL